MEVLSKFFSKENILLSPGHKDDQHFPEFGLEAQLYGKEKMEELSPHIRDRYETHTSQRRGTKIKAVRFVP
jgi:hypothetical protein